MYVCSRCVCAGRPEGDWKRRRKRGLEYKERLKITKV